jgi:hypothetical protein
MPKFDIPIPAELQQLMELPPCEELKLPSPKPVQVQLPTGATLKAFADISKGVPNDCSMTFSLLLQVAPLLASMECLIKILKFIKPLMDFVKNPADVTVVKKVLDAGAALAPCFLIPTPANMIPFVRDLLCLILRLLNCFVGQLTTVLDTMSGLSVQLKIAESAGNSELQRSLQCAMDNSALAAQAQMQSIEPVGAILDLMSPLMEIAGVQPIKLPQMGGAGDLDSLRKALDSVKSLTQTMQQVVDAIGGCAA